MKKIYLMRHGESTANAEKTVQGGDSELSEKGHHQAAALAARVQHLDFQNLVVSDFVRTRQTVAAILPFTSVQPVYTPLVRELKRPSALIGAPRHGEGMTVFEKEVSMHSMDPLWHFADEENYFDVVARVQKFFAYVDTLDGDTVVISHGRFIIFVMMYVILQGKLTPDVWPANLSTFTQENTGITVLTYKEHKKMWALSTYNDHSHFAE
jgi:broad specificity phosphatase PhoE